MNAVPCRFCRQIPQIVRLDPPKKVGPTLNYWKWLCCVPGAGFAGDVSRDEVVNFWNKRNVVTYKREYESYEITRVFDRDGEELSF